jgi:hypothetical protein
MDSVEGLILTMCNKIRKLIENDHLSFCFVPLLHRFVGRKTKVCYSFPAWNNSQTIADVEDRARVDGVKFREAGLGPIQKTYRYDPTNVKQRKANQ